MYITILTIVINVLKYWIYTKTFLKLYIYMFRYTEIYITLQ